MNLTIHLENGEEIACSSPYIHVSYSPNSETKVSFVHWLGHTVLAEHITSLNFTYDELGKILEILLQEDSPRYEKIFNAICKKCKNDLTSIVKFMKRYQDFFFIDMSNIVNVPQENFPKFNNRAAQTEILGALTRRLSEGGAEYVTIPTENIRIFFPIL